MKDSQGNEIKLNEQYIFWDNGMIGFNIDILINFKPNSEKPYVCHDGIFDNCILATTNNITIKTKETKLKHKHNQELNNLWGNQELKVYKCYESYGNDDLSTDQMKFLGYVESRTIEEALNIGQNKFNPICLEIKIE